ncbi:uncharacterized protein BP5553_05989 [Venustampulla echinocandica]|uniref:Uncharacterized protein n=1 Tax=Venustampulla echinocandica TaxID=2656787 RepID=A0A370TM86_9HELO|nr:uncharacterized protein BP5553_05989 [Venustampulla echinocandica]RDL36637.1 hypothetical protein BP5553_05989 [Venustampulla echinocandica]
MASEIPSSTEPTILFRPSKKRKIYRSRAHDDDDVEIPSVSPPPAAGAAPQSLDELIVTTSATSGNDMGDVVEAEGIAVPMSEILRLRKQRKGRFGRGVEFTAESANRATKEYGREMVVSREDGDAEKEDVEGESSVAKGVPRRFAPQTGTVGDVDRHMMAYIDSQLAKRQMEGLQLTEKSSHATLPSADSPAKPEFNVSDGSAKVSEVHRQPAAQGKLMEIDLGDEARHRNVERTTQATRRLNGEEIEEENTRSGKPVKVRLGRDGKPWRGRKRRGSDDIKRDKLVEEVLRENRLEIYDEPQEEPPNPGDNDQAADDRIAEAFRREFMDAVSARQRKKANPAPPPSRTVAGKKEEELMKGPKLGGSRSARAAMRETMLKNAKK